MNHKKYDRPPRRQKRCDYQPARQNKTNASKPKVNRRMDQALKLLHKGGLLVKETFQQGKKRLDRFFIKFGGKTYAVRKKIAGLLLGVKGALERIASGAALSFWKLTFHGKSYVEVSL